MAEKSGGNMADPGAAADGAEAGRTRRIGGRTAAIAAAVVVALLAAGGVAWKVHADDLLTQARSDCAEASERLRAATNDYNALLNGQAATMAKTDVKSVKDAKTLDALSKAVKAATPTVVSCRADSRTGVQEATRRVTANAAWYKAHRKSLSRLVEAVETSRLDKTVDDANALYEATDGKVQDDKTRATLLDAIKKRDADAIARAVKAVNESKAVKEKADAEAKARAEQEAAAAAAAQQAQAAQSQSYSGGSSNGNGGGSSYTPSQSTGNGGSSAGSSSSGDVHYDWEDTGTFNPNCDGHHFCPIG